MSASKWIDPARVLIVGGGIGGLSAALCLAARGAQVSVFEQSSLFGEIGAGLQLSPNCVRVLDHLGLGEALRARAFQPEATQFRDWRTGEVIAESPLGHSVVERFGFPHCQAHRADLLDILLDAARRSPLIELNLGARAVGCEQDEARVRITFEDREEEGAALIGADGIHSCIREQLWGPEAPRFTGCIAWRTLVRADRLPRGLIRPVTTVWWGPGGHFVHYFVRGGALLNCVCVRERDAWQAESWTQRGSLAELNADFAGWHSDIQTLLDNVDADSLFKWGLFDRAPMARWGQGRISLLGDACHPTLPFMAQGAAMAIEDSAVLAACVARGPSIGDALGRYEDLRRERTGAIQIGSRRNATLFHLAGVEAEARNRRMSREGAPSSDSLFSYDALRAAD